MWLRGDVRGVNLAEQRLAEAKTLGFATCILPKVCLKGVQKTDDIQLIGVENVREALNLL